jgi:hypothetical protein
MYEASFEIRHVGAAAAESQRERERERERDSENFIIRGILKLVLRYTLTDISA